MKAEGRVPEGQLGVLEPTEEIMESSQPNRIGAASAEGLRRQAQTKVWPVDDPRAELARELECGEGAWLDPLLELGIAPDTAPAFEALPLVEVAWSDGSVDTEERWRVLAAATAFGLELGRPAHAQLELWLEERPAQALFDAWYGFAAQALVGRRTARRARRVIEAAHEVAVAAGGIFGLGAVSRPERTVVERIRETLGHEEKGHED
jgi:tellurite resistance protein